MARRIGLKQDSMLYKGVVTVTFPDGSSRKYFEYGPYETHGVAAQVASSTTNSNNRWAQQRASNLGTVIVEVYTYEVIKGRMVWFEGEK